MKVGLVTVPLYDRSLEDMLAYVKASASKPLRSVPADFPDKAIATARSFSPIRAN